MSLILGLIEMLLLGAWFVLRWHRLQQALQWWYRQHVLRLFDEAEAARNGVLQDAFTLRRTVELSLIQHQALKKADEEKLLMTLGELHDSLKRFSDFLSPPYLEDSFPMSIEHLLRSHQHPDVVLDFSLPKKWQPNSYEQSRVVWIAIDELLRIAIAPSVESISACLTQRTTTHEFMIQIFYSNDNCQIFQTQLTELSHLRRAAQFLTAGTCTYHFDNATLKWLLQWS
ncbi:hypothetical protein H6F51_00380 [Cyanobacteria bacterium FACHB-DQ100]|nr:hypothetical protein [Cyanobacteria bacterium FACHB-DQ100]